MEVLDRTDMESIITWMPHGRAFVVLQPQQLRDIVLPRFFKQTKFMSFTRQLNLWGFKRITKGVDSGAYYHELFLRGRPRLAILMKRQKIKGTGIKLTPNPETEPDFYKISKKRPLPPVDASRREDKPLPPLRQNIQNRNFDAPQSNVLEYERMVRRLNSRGIQQPFEQQQIYPFSNASFYPGRQGVAQGFDVAMNVGMNMGMGMATLPNSVGPYLAPGTNNTGTNPSLNDSVTIQQLLLRQQLQPNIPLNGIFNQGMNNNAVASNPNEALALQQLLLRQQLHSNSLREAESQNARIAAAQQLLSQLNGSSSASNDSIQIQQLKQRLLNAASSLDSLNIMNNYNSDAQLSQLPPSNQFLPNVFGQQQQHQQYQQNLPNNNNFNVFLSALQNPSDVAASQAHFQQQMPRNYPNSHDNNHINNNPNMGSY
jgi:Heat shock transcription factor